MDEQTESAGLVPATVDDGPRIRARQQSGAGPVSCTTCFVASVNFIFSPFTRQVDPCLQKPNQHFSKSDEG